MTNAESATLLLVAGVTFGGFSRSPHLPPARGSLPGTAGPGQAAPAASEAPPTPGTRAR